jgi:hypothetical protein
VGEWMWIMGVKVAMVINQAKSGNIMDGWIEGHVIGMTIYNIWM